MKAVARCLALAAAFAPALPTRAADLPQPVAPAVEAARRALVGEWRLDSARSDDTTLVLAHLAASSRVAGGASGGDPWTDAPWAGNPWTGPHGRGGLRLAVGARIEPERVFTPSLFTVTNLVPEVTILEVDGGVRRLRADATPHRAANGMETTARWNGGRLVVETRTRGGRIVETWSASLEPRRLEILLQVAQCRGGTTSLRRVFAGIDRRPSAAETSALPATSSSPGFLLLQASRESTADAPAVPGERLHYTLPGG